VSHGECVRDRAAVDIQPRRAESRGLDLPFVTWNGLNVACATNRPDLNIEPREAKMPILRVVVDRIRSADRGWHRLRRREPSGCLISLKQRSLGAVWSLLPRGVQLGGRVRDLSLGMHNLYI